MSSFDRGFGPGVVRSKNSVVEGDWNRVRLHCNNWNGYVQLNDDPTAKGKPKVRYDIRKTDRKSVLRGVEVVMHQGKLYGRFCDFIAFSQFDAVMVYSHDITAVRCSDKITYV